MPLGPPASFGLAAAAQTGQSGRRDGDRRGERGRAQAADAPTRRAEAGDPAGSNRAPGRACETGTPAHVRVGWLARNGQDYRARQPTSAAAVVA
jgi:hypothetical protein